MPLQFTIIDYTTNPAGVSTVVNEPVGWDSTTLRLKRDKTWHGFFDFFDDSYGKMQWHGAAYTILQNAYNTYGVQALCNLLVTYSCSDTDIPHEIYRGNFVFAGYNQVCGDLCYAECGVESDTCLTQFRSRYDQKVNLNQLDTFDDDACGNNINITGVTLDFYNVFSGQTTFKVIGQVLPTTYSGRWLTISSATVYNGTYLITNIVVSGADTLITIQAELPLAAGIAANIKSHCLQPYNALNKAVALKPVVLLRNAQWNIAKDYYYSFITLVPGDEVVGLYVTPFAPLVANDLDLAFSLSENCEVNAKPFDWSAETSAIYNASEPNVQYPLTIDYDIDISGTFLDNQTVVGADRTNFEAALYLMWGFRDTSNDNSLNQTKLIDFSGYSADPFTYNFSTVAAGTSTGSLTLMPGHSVWLFWRITYKLDYSDATAHISWLYNASTIKFSTQTTMSQTDAKTYLVNEALSRCTEAYTGDCLRVKSDYFGRTDSQPYPSLTDGCAGLASVTNGLQIRNATMQDGSQPAMSVSMQQLFEALKTVYNIGMGLEPDEVRGGTNMWLRVEPVEYFYDNDVLVVLNNITEVSTRCDAERLYSKLNIGYSKWETENVDGLKDVFTKREYRTSLKETNREYTQLSTFIASCNAIEITRRKYGISSKDWRYDNNIFFLLLARTFAGFESESGIADAYENLPHANTLYNLRITPVRNLLRHLKSVLQCYRNYTTGKVVFSSGDGNLVAQTDLNNSTCVLENGVLSENQDVSPATLATPAAAYPYASAELVTFEYPVTWQQYLAIKANPYGLIGYQCGSGPIQYGWIEDFQLKPYTGMAKFTLRQQIES